MFWPRCFWRCRAERSPSWRRWRGVRLAANGRTGTCDPRRHFAARRVGMCRWCLVGGRTRRWTLGGHPQWWLSLRLEGFGWWRTIWSQATLAGIPLPSRRIHQGGRVWTSESVGYDKINYNWLSRRTIIKLRSIGFQIDEQHPFKSLLNSSKLVAFRTHEFD